VVFALKIKARGGVFGHRHPSDLVEPSINDKEATKRPREAGHLLGIEVLDHLILGKSRFFSFAREGLLPV